MSTKKLFLPFLLLLCLPYLFAEPISLHDKQLTFLYTCSIRGKYAFDPQGSKGITTIGEIKRREAAVQGEQNGLVLLFSNGNFLGQPISKQTNYTYLSSLPFDGIFLSPQELDVLEKTPPPKNLSIPFLAHRESLLYYPGEQVYKMGSYRILITSIAKRRQKKINRRRYDATIVFLEEGELPDESLKHLYNTPLIYIFSGRKKNRYSFQKNIYFAECPDSMEKVGKIQLSFRNGYLIRNHQEFIFLNSNDRNHSWIEPYSAREK
ncbi:MAG: hypothetical protein AAF518_25230 [Spirochaetota bacterium]